MPAGHWQRVRVNTYLTNQYGAGVAMTANGDFVVTWTSDGQDGSGQGVYAQRFNASGVAQGSEFRVNTAAARKRISHGSHGRKWQLCRYLD